MNSTLASGSGDGDVTMIEPPSFVFGSGGKRSNTAPQGNAANKEKQVKPNQQPTNSQTFGSALNQTPGFKFDPSFEYAKATQINNGMTRFAHKGTVRGAGKPKKLQYWLRDKYPQGTTALATVCKPESELRHQSSDKCCVVGCQGSHNFRSCPIFNNYV